MRDEKVTKSGIQIGNIKDMISPISCY